MLILSIYAYTIPSGPFLTRTYSTRCIVHLIPNWFGDIIIIIIIIIIIWRREIMKLLTTWTLWQFIT
jgi:hypothetical protein